MRDEIIYASGRALLKKNNFAYMSKDTAMYFKTAHKKMAAKKKAVKKVAKKKVAKKTAKKKTAKRM